jgi:hypothetical protein
MKDTVFIVNPETMELVSPYEDLPKPSRLVAAQTFTVSMVAAVVAEDLDGIFRGDNDLLVISKSSMGEQPPVERIHFFEEEVSKGHPIKNILCENVFIADDYNGTDKLWIEIDVLEIDTDTGERYAAVNAFQSLAATAGAVFPVILPYVFGASAAAGVLNKLVAAFEKNKYVIPVPFAMYPGVPRTGRAVLQAGTFVAFAKPQDASGLKLQENGLLTASDQSSELSYIVFEVSPKKQVSPKFVTSQKVATLLTQLKKGNVSSALGTIDFLTDTLTQYSNFKKLSRYLDLKSKTELTEEEKALMAEISKLDILKPFLPTT